MLTFTLANGKASEERADPVRIISMRTVVNSQEEDAVEEDAEEKHKLR